MVKRFSLFFLTLILLWVAFRTPVIGEFNNTLLHWFKPSITDTKKAPHQALMPPPAFTTNSLLAENQWVDSVFSSMDADQKIGQFFMVAINPTHGEAHFKRIETLIQTNHIGGLIFFQGDPFSYASLNNRFQSGTRIPLLIGIDGEWGLAMRVNSTMAFPKQITLGAIQDNSLIYKMGGEIARQCKRLGIHLNFAPVVDINSNPNNPVIGYRSFGELRENVALKSSAYMKGMQNNQLLACAKHFPGHGDTQGDSHFTLPQLSFNAERLKSVELYPFQQLINDSIKTVIVGHLQVPFYDWRPATLSQSIITNLLKTEMGFKGLVITDALNMKGVRHGQGITSGEVDLQAFIAGNDILLYSENIPEGIRKIKEAINAGLIQQTDIDNRVRKILHAKYWVGLNQFKYIDSNNLYQDLNTNEANKIKQELFDNAITVVKDAKNVLPIAPTEAKFISIGLDIALGNRFQQELSRITPFQHFASASKTDEVFFNNVLQYIDSTSTVILSVHDINKKTANKLEVGYNIQNFVKRLEQKAQKVVVCVFGSPYSLKYFPESSSLICGYEDDQTAYSAMARVIFGEIPAIGKLPVSVENLFKAGEGINISGVGKFAKSSPESVGMKSIELFAIDQLVQSSIAQRIFPGCQVLVARKGKIVYEKNFGKMSYDANSETVNSNTVYDLASVTKVSATLQALMVLYDQKKFSLDEKASHYLPELKGTNKENIIIRDILWHQAGLVAYIPFWEKTRIPLGWKTEYYNTKQSAEYPLEVAEGMFAKASIRDSVWKWVIKSPLINKREKDGSFPFVYSDLGLMILHHLVEKLSNQPLDAFTTKNFYEPLAMNTTGFNPLKKINKNQIAPTENDNLFRGRLLQGTVQDQTAAMLGGVSGHAGLFSNASDLAKLLQMNLNKGSFGSKQFISEQTINLFTNSKATRSYRVLGWDKLPSDGDSNFVSNKVSSSSYGHSGYTGTLVWIDPEKELVFVFLSNRVNPSAGNNKINTLKIRRKVMDIVYKSME
ncbi:glycoside hydrolase family 3 N-terminal domain-containing protein [Arcicella sp. LKC2W]|uniref:glycoside hydrolase family 3 N-terminal domain-containing protein n=1 Tax=Arcicella sp. LKC2W TaxID=2984198 RepID=UPI002B1E9453|nr:glycoside hydrolase family 3 N-terminal domain-containing protein [Arcicella sp. LKC2W]MEA5457872.1 glycoside hydrolase family 3 N-terminal domain-containing protein [Arcicella sp. LKC2W]